jgi:hypothetical protein
MYQIDNSTAATTRPASTAPGSPGWFTDGNPAGGIAATIVPAEWLNMVQAEIESVIQAAGITLNKSVSNQLATAIQSGLMNYAADTGTANVYAVAYTPALAALTDGLVVWFKAKTANTGASTLNVNGLGAQPILGAAHSALQGGEIVANGRVELIWNATLTSWVLTEQTGGALQVPNATASSQAMPLGQATGRLLNVQVFTASGTYTPSSSLVTSVIVDGVGGGAGGGGCPATTSSQQATAGGGNAGNWARARFTAAFTGVSVTIGAAGTAGATGANAGGAGGTTSFGSLLTIQGGAGGAGGTAGAAALGIFPPTANASIPSISGGTLLGSSRGTSGQSQIILSLSVIQSGGGGSSPYGAGGVPVQGVTGNAGSGNGSGGSGCSQTPSEAGSPGGAGQPGILYIYEYA